MLPFSRLILQLAVVTGIIMVCRHLIYGFSQRMNRRQELKDHLLKNITEKKTKRSRFKQHIEDLMLLSYSNFEPTVSYHRFLLTSLLYAVAVFITIFFTVDNLPHQLTNNPFQVEISNRVGAAANWRVSLVFSIITLCTPYLVLRYRFMIANTKASYDLMEPTKFMTKYAHLSVDKALSETAKMIPTNNVVRLALRQLSLMYTSYRNEEELLLANKRFIGLIGTTFAAQFANNLLYAEREGAQHMKNDFQSLHQSMEIQRETIMEVKANSRDAVQMGIYINLIVFVALVGSLMFFMRPTVYLKFQFETPVGLALLIAILISYLASVLFSIALSRPKLDY